MPITHLANASLTLGIDWYRSLIEVTEEEDRQEKDQEQEQEQEQERGGAGGGAERRRRGGGRRGGRGGVASYSIDCNGQGKCLLCTC